MVGKPRPDKLFPLEVGHPVGEEGEGKPAAPGLRQEGLRLRVQGVAAPLPEEGLGELPRPFGGPPASSKASRKTRSRKGPAQAARASRPGVLYRAQRASRAEWPMASAQG